MGTHEPGTSDPAPSGLADALFTSVQQRVLAVLFGQPRRRFQSAELIQLVDAGRGATHRLVSRLVECGLVQVETQGRQKYYRANPASPVYEELVALVRKTVGLVEPLREALSPLHGDVEVAFVYGSVAEGTDDAESDIDLMVIARELDYPVLYDALERAEQMLGRSVNPNLMTPDEWQRKSMESDSFAARVRQKPRLFILGSEDALG
jgi:predicted nucleotidyltransferase